MEDTEMLQQIRAVWKAWDRSTHKWRSSHAMVKINKLFEPAAAKE